MSEVKFCVRCDECWPADSEFFFANSGSRDGFDKYCKACHSEMPSRTRRRAAIVRPVPFCSPWEVLFDDTHAT